MHVWCIVRCQAACLKSNCFHSHHIHTHTHTQAYIDSIPPTGPTSGDGPVPGSIPVNANLSASFVPAAMRRWNASDTAAGKVITEGGQADLLPPKPKMSRLDAILWQLGLVLVILGFSGVLIVMFAGIWRYARVISSGGNGNGGGRAGHPVTVTAR